MLLNVLTGAGQPAIIVVQAQDTITDRSGSIAATGASQILMAANPLRSGWFFQNLGTNAMTVSELGADATLPGAIMVRAGDMFPPPGYPVPIGAITIAGAEGDAFAAREF